MIDRRLLDRADIKTKEALETQRRLRSILHSVKQFSVLKELKKRFQLPKFDEPAPTPPSGQQLPREPKFPVEPNLHDAKYQVSLSIIDRLFPSHRQRKLMAARSLFSEDHAAWRQTVEKRRANWERKRDRVLRKEENEQIQFQEHMKKWKSRKEEYSVLTKNKEDFLSELIDNYNNEKESCESYFMACVEQFMKKVPLEFYQNDNSSKVRSRYDPESKIILFELYLPEPTDIPTIKEWKPIKSRYEIKPLYLSDREQKKLYDDILYQIALSVVAIIFKVDKKKAIDLASFNGRVQSRDEATGNLFDACIISLQINRDEMKDIELEHVDARACFQKLRGVGSGKLHALVPVAPLLEFDTLDDRFVAGREVASGLTGGQNLAAMDWQDFEHLVRELFEAQFAEKGGSVRITRASRDRGVDAIAFDPDPIRGGKIVIQAKRYTNLVGVESVRDLYGTVMNEGAIKGILVTTSNYGPDAYSFAKDKPLTLLNGSNLLHLLQSHGYRARIDLREAKQILAGQ